MAKQRYYCAQAGCLRSLYAGFHVDHIVAIANGGKHEESNLQLLCPPHNLAKGAR